MFTRDDERGLVSVQDFWQSTNPIEAKQPISPVGGDDRAWGRTRDVPIVAKVAGAIEALLWLCVVTAAVGIPTLAAGTRRANFVFTEFGSGN